MTHKEIDLDNDGKTDLIIESANPSSFSRAKAIITSLAITFIAVGQWNDAIDVIDRVYDFAYSKFTDMPSRNKLNKIYIRASEEALEDNLGAPIYLKETSEGYTVKYYKDSRFILSAITQDNAIAAYLVFPLNGFIPSTKEHAGGSTLLTSAFNINENAISAHSSYSRSVSYYIEEESGGDYKFLYTSIGGFSTFNQKLTDTQATLLSEFSDTQVLGGNEKKAQKALRAQFTPNFYGYSKLNSILALEDAILTNSEYRLILNH